MRKSFSTIVVFLVITLFGFSQIESPHVKAQYLVLLQNQDQLPTVLEKNQFISNRFTNLVLIRQLSSSMSIFLLQSDSLVNENIVLNQLRATPGVTLAQFNHYIASRSTFPNDTYFSSMWSLNNTGQSGGTPDADIDAPEAWDITTGGITSTGDTIVVAVVDGGFQLTHPDLNFWKNYNEIPGNGFDDDGNGYIDDRNGWNAVSHSPSLGSNSHGTHVSGTIGARGNSGTGTTGISWNVKVMAVQGSTGTESVAVEAYDYILQTRRLYNQSGGAKGAFVVATNSSFGVDQGQPANFPIWCAMYDSLGSEGILSAGATANQNWNIDVVGDIPTACVSPYLISVTNTTRNDVKYTSAGYGLTTIDIGAPGTSIYSTIPTSTWSMTNWTGTSMATPHVAGTIGLMFAAACPQFIQDYKANPAGLAIVMRDYLLNAVDTLTVLSNLCATGGRLNAFNSLQNVQSYAGCLSTSYSNEENSEPLMLGIYPNPASDICELEYRATHTEISFRFFDITGKLLKEISRKSVLGYNRHTLNIAELPAGIYFVQLCSNGQTTHSIKLMKY
jgi:subtilisin family serine protease